MSLNPNHMVKGSGTWTAEEDERLSKLVEVVGMKVGRGERGVCVCIYPSAYNRRNPALSS